MSVSCLSQVALDYTAGSSDKVYVIQVQQHDLGGGSIEYRAVGYYGRRGSALSIAEKYKGPSKASAEAAANRLDTEKRGKGYGTMAVPAGSTISGMPSSAPTFGGASAAATATSTKAAPKVVGPLPMLATPVARGDETAEELIKDSNWVAQCKYDGERVTVSLRRTGITAFNRKGEVRPLTAPAEKELKELLALPDFGNERETVLDGELMGDVFVAYDLITLRDIDYREYAFDERYAALEELLANNMGLLAPTAWSEAEKRAMLSKAQSEDWEGLCFRRLDADYIAGRSVNLLKYKLWATCTCRVLATSSTKRSIQVGLRDEHGAEVFAGNVTVPVNQNIPELDSLVEVRYLYALDGGSLYQPTLLQVRDDIDEADLRSSVRAAPPEKRGGVAVTSAVAETVEA